MGQQMDDLDELSVHCQKILSTQYSEKLDELYRLGGTSGGARPKIMTEIDGETGLLNFRHMWTKRCGKNGIRLFSVCKSLWNCNE